MFEKDQSFRLWTPVDGVWGMYEPDAWQDTREGFVVLMEPKPGQGAERLKLTWKHGVLVYSVSLESYRSDCWISKGDLTGSFFVSENSKALDWYRTNSPCFPEPSYHFLLVGWATYIVDVIAEEYPLVRVF